MSTYDDGKLNILIVKISLPHIPDSLQMLSTTNMRWTLFNNLILKRSTTRRMMTFQCKTFASTYDDGKLNILIVKISLPHIPDSFQMLSMTNMRWTLFNNLILKRSTTRRMMTLQKNSVTRISEVYRNGDSSQKVTFYEKLHLKTVKKR